ncbi:ion channel [Marinobacterium arenosum]|uniref:ion channel n=1 Tax=Marinobacterium arenosum TaxID=2862496 RepID=UPI001C961867|nr:ion channel [Marinobacterium arenosum]MBY4676351.1 NAD-binding protein [Marinobacterium arenosum]
MFKFIRRLIYRHLKQMNWQALGVMLAIYVSLCWLLLKAAGETALLGDDFLYWLVVTASTVGYGDLSPASHGGKLIVALVVIPFGLGLFALTVGKLAAFSALQWRKGIMGQKDLNLHDHILVIGWNPERTTSLLKLLQLEARQYRNRNLCLCVTDEMENPLPGEIEFIRSQAFNDDEDMDRACIADASTLIVDTGTDDSTLTAALYAYSRNPQAHIIAYFRDESLSRLLKQHCPTVECAPSVSTEMLVKAAMDPGSSLLHQELLTAGSGMTQYSTTYPDGLPELSVRDLFIPLKEHYGATLIAVDLDHDGRPDLNPSLDKRIKAGSLIYYIAPGRIKNFDWQALAAR